MKSILIVEDEDIIAQNIATSLKKMGYKNIYIAKSGAGAIKIIEEQHPDLILVDIVLPGKIDGIELAHIIKDRINLPFIFVTADSDEDTVKKAKITEPYGYIIKPVRKRELQIVIDITFHKFEMDKKLRESEERLSLALESAGLGLWDQNFKTNKIIRNERWAEMLGYKVEDIDSDIKGMTNLIHPDDRTKVKDAMKDHELGKTEHYNIEHRMKTKTGDWKWILNWGKIVCRDKDGAPVRALGTHFDITERK